MENVPTCQGCGLRPVEVISDSDEGVAFERLANRCTRCLERGDQGPVDLTAPEHPVQVEVQDRPSGKVLYVHVDGRTVLRVCRITKGVTFETMAELSPAQVKEITAMLNGDPLGGWTPNPLRRLMRWLFPIQWTTRESRESGGWAKGTEEAIDEARWRS